MNHRCGVGKPCNISLLAPFGLPDAPFQVSPGCAVPGPVPGPESSVTGLEEFLDLLTHPWFLAWKNADAVVHSDIIHTDGDVKQHS